MTSEEKNDSFSIDLDQNSASLSIPKDIYLRILRKAIEQTRKDISDLEAALSADDIATVQSISHRLKGDYANMRILTLSAIAKQINDMSKEKKDKEALTALLNDFKSDFQQVCRFLEAQN